MCSIEINNIEINIKDIDLKFITSDKLFSPRNIDIGTLSMLDEVNFENESKVLDLGCDTCSRYIG